MINRSPSPNRRKSCIQKTRNSRRRKVKVDCYDADLSMDSLNSVVPLRVDEHGRINVLPEDNKHRSKAQRKEENKMRNDEKLDVWCGQQILTQLASLRNVSKIIILDRKELNLKLIGILYALTLITGSSFKATRVGSRAMCRLTQCRFLLDYN